VPPLRATDHADSLEVCRYKLNRLLDERRLSPFDEQQERRYKTLCEMELMFLRADRRIAAKLAEDIRAA
jgi:hypothetical protein